jgi:hypothetical protein
LESSAPLGDWTLDEPPLGACPLDEPFPDDPPLGVVPPELGGFVVAGAALLGGGSDGGFEPALDGGTDGGFEPPLDGGTDGGFEPPFDGGLLVAAGDLVPPVLLLSGFGTGTLVTPSTDP